MCGNTRTTSSTRTAAPTTSPRGGTWSIGKWRRTGSTARSEAKRASRRNAETWHGRGAHATFFFVPPASSSDPALLPKEVQHDRHRDPHEHDRGPEAPHVVK